MLWHLNECGREPHHNEKPKRTKENWKSGREWKRHTKGYAGCQFDKHGQHDNAAGLRCVIALVAGKRFRRHAQKQGVMHHLHKPNQPGHEHTCRKVNQKNRLHHCNFTHHNDTRIHPVAMPNPECLAQSTQGSPMQQIGAAATLWEKPSFLSPTRIAPCKAALERIAPSSHSWLFSFRCCIPNSAPSDSVRACRSSKVIFHWRG